MRADNASPLAGSHLSHQRTQVTLFLRDKLCVFFHCDSAQGVYEFHFFKDGIPKHIVVDSFLPFAATDSGARVPAFGRSAKPKEVWVSLLEKVC